MIFADGPVLRRKDLPELGALGPAVRPPEELADEAAFHIPECLTLPEDEREYIRRTLARFDSSVQRTAEALGISRKNLWEKRKKHGLLPTPENKG